MSRFISRSSRFWAEAATGINTHARASQVAVRIGFILTFILTFPFSHFALIHDRRTEGGTERVGVKTQNGAAPPRAGAAPDMGWRALRYCAPAKWSWRFFCQQPSFESEQTGFSLP